VGGGKKKGERIFDPHRGTIGEIGKRADRCFQSGGGLKKERGIGKQPKLRGKN